MRDATGARVTRHAAGVDYAKGEDKTVVAVAIHEPNKPAELVYIRPQPDGMTAAEWSLFARRVERMNQAELRRLVEENKEG